MNKTKIQYLDYDWNITHGCSKISAGCQNCWAEKMSKRLAGMNARGYDKENPFAVKFCEWKLQEPLLQKKPSVIGVSFMSDLFHKDITNEQIIKVFNVMLLKANQHKYIILTKRPERLVKLMRYIRFNYLTLKDIWFGCSIENNKELLNRIDPMDTLKHDYNLNIWVSIEPLLEDISDNFAKAIHMKVFDWVVIGGESGTSARYCNPEWITKIISLCYSHKIPVYFKQYGTNKDNKSFGYYLEEVKQFPKRLKP